VRIQDHGTGGIGLPYSRRGQRRGFTGSLRPDYQLTGQIPALEGLISGLPTVQELSGRPANANASRNTNLKVVSDNTLQISGQSEPTSATSPVLAAPATFHLRDPYPTKYLQVKIKSRMSTRGEDWFDSPAGFYSWCFKPESNEAFEDHEKPVNSPACWPR
jgi:hypothetical protein